MVYYSVDRYNEDMFLVGLLSWWYGSGWRGRLNRTGRQIVSVVEMFSIGQLFLTLFAPFRQISADSVNGSAAVQLRGFFDKTLSRVIGAIVRLITIIAGIVTMLFVALYQVLILVFWLVLPFTIVAGIVLAVIGWTPEW